MEQIAKLKEWDALFPAVAEVDKEAPNSHKYAEELWEQLDHLGYVNQNSSIKGKKHLWTSGSEKQNQQPGIYMQECRV